MDIVITDEDFGLKSVEFKNPRKRLGARGIIRNNTGMIAILHKKKMNEYKLPGGGIDEGEDPAEAFKREALEETGCNIRIVSKFGTIVENKTLDNFTQTSYVFLASVVKDNKVLNLTDREKEEGSELLWISPTDALKLIDESFDKLVPSKYENTYHSKFIALRDKKILEYYLEVY